MNKSVYAKTMENILKHLGIKLVTTERRRNYLLSEPKYHRTKFFIKNLLAVEMRKTQILMNKLVYLVLSILDLSKTVTNEFWYDYINSKYGEKARLSYMDTDRFIVYIKTDDIYKDVAEDNKTRFDASNYELDVPLPKEKNKKVIGTMKDELVVNIMKEFVGLRAKAYSYLIDDSNEDKKAKSTKKHVTKRIL